MTQEFTYEKFSEINSKLKNDKQPHGNETDEMRQGKKYLCERLRDTEDRSRRNNLMIDG